MTDKELMAEAAILYYEKKMTQQEIADTLYLSRQTVSKLLNEALQENIVEITVHHPKKDCERLSGEIQNKLGIKKVVVSTVGSRNESVRLMLTVRTAIDYILPIVNEGGKNIALSWGRTVQMLVSELHELNTKGNTVFPLFGATDHENSYFASNELARSLADKIGAKVKYAWFPYLPDNNSDLDLFKKTLYYENMEKMWDNIDLGIVGIGSLEILEMFKSTFGHIGENSEAVGDIATHFFNADGNILDLYKNTLCVSTKQLKNAKQTVAIACGDDKAAAISAALKTGLVDVLITDEYTAKEIIAIS